MARERALRVRLNPVDLLFALATVVAASALAELCYRFIGVTRIGVIFVAAVIFAAGYRGRSAGFIAAILSVFAYNLFMVPRNSISLTSEDAVNLVTFLAVALVVGNLAGALKEHARQIELQSSRLQLLFDTSRAMSATADEKAITVRLCDGVTPLADGAAFIDAAGGMTWSVGDAPPPELVADAHAAYSQRGEASPGTVGGFRAYPLKNGGDHFGVLLWRPHKAGEKDESEDVVAILADLASTAVARSRLAEEAARLQARAQGERFREALLSSVSHDFRSPLAAIIGSVTSLIEYGDRFDTTIQRDLLLNIKEEGERLNHFVENLLSWSRIKAGTLQLDSGPVNLTELAERVVRRLLGTETGGRCSIEPGDRTTANADGVLLEQAVFNIVDNALRYSAPNGQVAIRIGCDEENCRIEVIDEGPGMAGTPSRGVFDGLEPVQIRGSGLGLSIATGLLEAMNGTIGVATRADGERGLNVTIAVPAAG